MSPSRGRASSFRFLLTRTGRKCGSARLTWPRSGARLAVDYPEDSQHFNVDPPGQGADGDRSGCSHVQICLPFWTTHFFAAWDVGRAAASGGGVGGRFIAAEEVAAVDRQTGADGGGSPFTDRGGVGSQLRMSVSQTQTRTYRWWTGSGACSLFSGHRVKSAHPSSTGGPHGWYFWWQLNRWRRCCPSKTVTWSM